MPHRKKWLKLCTNFKSTNKVIRHTNNKVHIFGLPNIEQSKFNLSRHGNKNRHHAHNTSRSHNLKNASHLPAEDIAFPISEKLKDIDSGLKFETQSDKPTFVSALNSVKYILSPNGRNNNKNSAKNDSDEVVYNCTTEDGYLIWTNNKIQENIMANALQPDCWAVDALKGVYNLEQTSVMNLKTRYNASNNGDIKTVNTIAHDIGNLDDIVCYLIQELNKCKDSMRLSNDMSNDSSKKTVDNHSTKNIAAAQNQLKSPEISDKIQQKATKHDSKSLPLFQNDFSLDWEADMLFY